MNNVMIDYQKVTRCYRCENWKNLSKRREADDVEADDLGICSLFGIVNDAIGYCNKAREVEEK